MKKLLYIDCCIRGDESRTRMLAKEYLDMLVRSDDYEVDELRLYDEALEPITEDEIEAREKLDDAKGGICDHARQFADADLVVMAAPYWDLSFPPPLKIYVEHLCVCGITFRYVGAQSEGLCQASGLVYVTTAGGFIGDADFGAEYMRAIAGFFGIKDFATIRAEGLDIIGMDHDAQLDEARRQMRALLDA